MAQGDLQTSILAMVMGELLRRRRSGGGDEGAEGFDGLGSTRVLQRGRTIKDQMARHPTRAVCEYEANWETELDAEGRPWCWRDVGHQLALDGRWCTVWKFTGLAYPYQKPRCGASALELEAALGEQKVEVDFGRRSKAVLAGTMEGADDGDETQPKGKVESRTKDKEA